MDSLSRGRGHRNGIDCTASRGGEEACGRTEGGRRTEGNGGVKA